MSEGPLANPQSQKRKRQREEDARRQHNEDLMAVMSTAAGRRFVWRLVDGLAGVFGASYAGDPAASAFGEGRRAVGIALMTEAQQLAPKLYVEMVTEQLRTLSEAVHNLD